MVSQFPHEPVHAPRSLAERLFDLRAWWHGTSGGHFSAWERPEGFVSFVRMALALV
jgi:hypothetical protein